MSRFVPISVVALVVLAVLGIGPLATAQDVLPTPRGQLGGREPLTPPPVLPLPTPVPTAPPTSTPTPSSVASPTPTPTPSPTPSPAATQPPIMPIDGPTQATPGNTPSLPEVAAAAATPTVPAAAAGSEPGTEAIGDDASTVSVERALDAAIPAVVTVLIDGPAGLRVGTGVVVFEGRHVVTSAALVGAATAGELVAADGTRSYASVVGVDGNSGIALLEASVDIAPPMTLAAREVAPGETVVGVGTADGAFPGTVIVGNVGIPSRAVPEVPATLLIQHDAALPGRSWGAALVGLDGTLVGLTIPLGFEGTDIVLPSGPPLPLPGEPSLPAPGAPPIQLPDDAGTEQQPGVAGGALAFAVPAPTIGRIVPDLRDDGAVAYPFIGVIFEPNELWPGGPPDGTVTVEDVLPDGPAAAAGIRPGDLIVGFEGGDLTTIRPFQLVLLAREPDQTVSVTIARDGAERVVEVVLGERPEE